MCKSMRWQDKSKLEDTQDMKIIDFKRIRSSRPIGAPSVLAHLKKVRLAMTWKKEMVTRTKIGLLKEGKRNGSRGQG